MKNLLFGAFFNDYPQHPAVRFRGGSAGHLSALDESSRLVYGCDAKVTNGPWLASFSFKKEGRELQAMIVELHKADNLIIRFKSIYN